MALAFEKGVLSAPGSTGNQTVNLGASFSSTQTLKAILLWTTRQTSSAIVDGEGYYSFGMGTYDGSAVQQWAHGYGDHDAITSSDTARHQLSTSILRGLKWSSANTWVVDFDVALVSFTNTSFTINWTDLPDAGTIKVHYVAIGGADVTRARVGNLTVSTTQTDQDFTVTSGFGKPDLLLFSSTGASATGDQQATSATITTAAAKSNTAQQVCFFGQGHAVNPSNVASWRDANALLSPTWSTTTVTASVRGGLADKTLWPTDGFRITFAPRDTARIYGYLALAGSFQSAIGTSATPTAGATPINTDVAVGFTPKGVLSWGTNVVAQGGVGTATATDLGAWFFGGADGTSQGGGGVAELDASGTSYAGRVHSETRGMEQLIPVSAAGPSLKSDAAISFSGTNVRYAWQAVDTAAREFCYLALGDAPAPATTGNKMEMLI